MKIKQYPRMLKPKSGRGKSRPGLFTATERTPENVEDFKQIFHEMRSSTAEEMLEKIVVETSEVLKELPEGGRLHVAHPSRKWEYISGFNWPLAVEEFKELFQKNYPPGTQVDGELGSSSLLVEPLSPEYYAIKARQFARLALRAIDEGALMEAVRDAMRAADNYHNMVFVKDIEYELTARVAQIKGPKGKSKERVWAIALAKHLRKQSTRFKVAWKTLPHGDIGVFAAYRVYRDHDDRLYASHTKTKKEEPSISVETFRTHYFSKYRD